MEWAQFSTELIHKQFNIYFCLYFYVLFLVGIGANMGSVNKNRARVHKSAPYCFFKDMTEDALKNICPLKASLVVLSKGRKVRNRPKQIVSDEPAVCYVHLDLLDCLPHTSDPIQILDKHDLKKHNGINSGIPPFCFFIQSLHFVIDEAPIDCILYLSQHMILRYQIFYTQQLQLCLLALILFFCTQKNTCLYGIYYTIIAGVSSIRLSFGSTVWGSFMP